MSNVWADSYREWLLNLLHEDISDPGFSHLMLMDVLDNISFVSFVPGDENRRHDGTYLRTRYIEERGQPLPLSIRRKPCTMLEMLIALSERMLFLSAVEDLWNSPRDTFHEMLTNLGILDITDEAFLDDPEDSRFRIEQACRRVNNQVYSRNGEGGLFPVQENERYDARDTEIWYQMQRYLIELEELYEEAE